jgi:hypothetical protein
MWGWIITATWLIIIIDVIKHVYIYQNQVVAQK